MNKHSKKLFERLESQYRDRARPRDPVDALWEMVFPKRASSHPKGTVARFADELRQPVELLIEQLEHAGIKGLTPLHRIDETHKYALLQYLRKSHRNSDHEATTSDLLFEQKLIEPSQVELLEDVNEELISRLANNPALLYQLAPRKFEELIAKLFSDRGYDVSLTQSTRDGGYDLLAKISDGITSTVVLAECKRYRQDNKVGVEVVRGLYGVTERHRANQGLIITSSYFTKDAIEEQLRIGNRIGLRDFNNLINWLKPYTR